MKTAAWLRSAARAGIDLLFPPSCRNCGANLDDIAPVDGSRSASGILKSADRLASSELADQVQLCRACLAAIEANIAPQCQRCAASITKVHASTGDIIIPSECAECRGTTWKFGQVVALGQYEGELREIVLRMKRARFDPLSRGMGELLWHYRQAQFAALAVDVVVPVPLYWLRRALRGTNSSEIIGQTIARHLHIPPAGWLLRRTRNTKPQWTLTQAARRRNVKQALRVPLRDKLTGLHVLLVDDILTTGATCDAAARALLRAGASQVSVAVVARAAGAMLDHRS